MPNFHGGNDYVERGDSSFHLKPLATATTRLIERSGTFHHQPLVTSCPGGRKFIVQCCDLVETLGSRQANAPFSRNEFTQLLQSFRECVVNQHAAAGVKKIIG